MLISPYSDLLWDKTWEDILSKARKEVRQSITQMFYDLRVELGLPTNTYQY